MNGWVVDNFMHIMLDTLCVTMLDFKYHHLIMMCSLENMSGMANWPSATASMA